MGWDEIENMVLDVVANIEFFERSPKLLCHLFKKVFEIGFLAGRNEAMKEQVERLEKTLAAE